MCWTVGWFLFGGRTALWEICKVQVLGQLPSVLWALTVLSDKLLIRASIMALHTCTHPFNSPLSRTTQVSRYQKRKSNLDFTKARDSEWQWHRLGHMQVCISLQTNNHASTSVFYRPVALPATQSTALKPTEGTVMALMEKKLSRWNGSWNGGGRLLLGQVGVQLLVNKWVHRPWNLSSGANKDCYTQKSTLYLSLTSPVTLYIEC